MKVFRFPFALDMKRAALDGRKSCTSRTKVYGVVGDSFFLGNVCFELLEVKKATLGFIARFLYNAEGFNSPAEFKAKWVALHPRKRWNPRQVVFVHFFKKVV